MDSRTIAQEAGYAPLVQDNQAKAEVRASGNDDDLDIVQFAAQIFLLSEAKGVLEIDVMRLGDKNGTVTVDYETVDGSGKAGSSYHATSGTLILGHGQARATLKVEAVANDTWAPTHEFSVKLVNPRDCTLGEFLHTARVKCLNDDPFPTNAFEKAAMQDGDFHPGFKLWWEYCRLNYSQPGMAWRTWFVLIVDQMKNVYMFFKLWFNVYLVDKVLNKDADSNELVLTGHRETEIVVMGVIWILPSVLLHVWQIAQVFIGVKEKSVGFLQDSLFREYLNFSEKSRSECLPSDMVVSVQGDCGDVAGSYCTAMHMVTEVVKLGIFVNFIYHHNRNALWVMGVFPALTIAFAGCRQAKQFRVASEAGDAEIRVLSLVTEVCNKYRLVADYMQRPFMNHELSKRMVDLRDKLKPQAVVFMNNEYFPAFLGFVFVGVYIITESENVLGGEISLGTYLATIGVFKDVADAFTGIYNSFVSLTKSFDPLAGLTEKYNKRTDLEAGKVIAKYNQEEQNDEQDRLAAERNKNLTAVKEKYPTDAMKLKLDNVTVRYRSGKAGVHHIHEPAIFENVTLSANQGQLIAITGHHGTGRASLLRLLGKVLFPESGEIIIPTHLRAVHVTKEPILMRLSLLENLAFGLPKHHGVLLNKEPEVARAKEILKMFGDEGLMEDLDFELSDKKPPAEGEEEEPDAEDGGWQERLTSMETAIIHLARAFIMNPEVYLMQRPLSNFSGVRAMTVLEIFKDCVAKKGLCMPSKGLEDRRPRTIFFAPETREQALGADVAWLLESKHNSKHTMNVKEVKPSDISEGVFS